MSYKWGTNGNDLDWDSVTCLNQFIEEIEIAIHEGEAELGEDGYPTDDWYMSMSDGNPTYIYYPGKEIDIQELLTTGKKLNDLLDWFIVHDTNGNFVTLVGDVPDDYLTEEYIQERKEAEEE
jgi:hypothetical protein